LRIHLSRPDGCFIHFSYSSFTIPSIQVQPLPVVESEKLFIQLLKATIIPIGKMVTTQELADGFTSRLSIMPLSYCGRKAISRSLSPERPKG
jgi:hypothetical protein